MYKLLGASALLIIGLNKTNEIPVEPFPEIENEYPLIWKAKTGNASFRTNVVFTGDYMIMGSNGERFMDYYTSDDHSGVHVISRKTGKILRTLDGSSIGDMDVNGVLVKGDRIYFGNDNEEFQCVTLEGKSIWRIPVSGDVEHEPAEIDINGRKAIVFSTESGEVRAVEPSNGKTIWTYYAPEFKGWKEGQNRTVFKIGSFFSNTNIFYTKPVVADINKDAVKDFIYLGYNSKIYAISGKSGKALWINEAENTTYGISLYVEQVNNEPVFKFHETSYNTSGTALYATYIITLNRFGKRIEQKQVPYYMYSAGLNSLTTATQNLVTLSSDSMHVYQNGKEIISINRAIPYTYIDYKKDTVSSIRNSYDALIGTSFFTHPEFGKCLVVLNQRDGMDQKGFIEIISMDQQKQVQKLSIPDIAEMPPVIEDVNKDGVLDLVINAHDGYTYCYSLTTKR